MGIAGKRELIELPYDKNGKPLSALVAAVVSGGNIVDYLPLKAVDNGDGSATLASTVNVTLDADVDIGNLNLLNVAGTKINPATEEKQDALLALDFATETTLATRASETTLLTVAKEVTLALVKTVLDGIKTAVDAINTTLDVALSSRASETTLLAIKTATEANVLLGVAEHHNGSATVTPATVNFSGTSKSILIENEDLSQNLLVSFDAGANTKTIGPGQSISIEASHASVQVSSSLGTISYEMLVTT